MGTVWDERFDRGRHKDHMPEMGARLDPRGSVIVVEVGRFRFEFLSIAQLEEALRYFRANTHPSTRMDVGGGDHWEFQPWYCRLPSIVRRPSNRARIVKALEQALEKYSSDVTYRPACR